VAETAFAATVGIVAVVVEVVLSSARTFSLTLFNRLLEFGIAYELVLRERLECSAGLGVDRRCFSSPPSLLLSIRLPSPCLFLCATALREVFLASISLKTR